MDHSLRLPFEWLKSLSLGLRAAGFFPDQSHFTCFPRLAGEGFFSTATPRHIQSTGSHQYQYQYQYHPLSSRGRHSSPQLPEKRPRGHRKPRRPGVVPKVVPQQLQRNYHVTFTQTVIPKTVFFYKKLLSVYFAG